MMVRSRLPFHDWAWRMANTNGNAQAGSFGQLREWTQASAIPSVVHMELLAKDIIPDPNVGENERLIQWVGHCDWEYQAFFETPQPSGKADEDHHDLVLEGLDTFATVFLNGNQILQSTNMFIPARIPVRSLMRRPGDKNHLTIYFESAYKVGTALNEKYGVKFSRMRDGRRNHTRKAQYHWGWDWGPNMLTAGPYMPVYLESYKMRIDNIHVLSTLADDHSQATISITVKTSSGNLATTAKIQIRDSDCAEVHVSEVRLCDEKTSINVTIPSPRLWWTHDLGPQHLYTVDACLLGPEAETLDATQLRFGIRTIELIQRSLDSKPGTTFMFRINGRDIFSQGANWIPLDNLLPTISRKRYFDWVKLVKQANMNMIRVWGGGIYETEDFFDACDEMGILVWHDYAFACGDYPLYDDFLNSIEKEAEAQTLRIRNRASLALLSGGNEDYLMFDWLRGEYYDHDDFEGPFDGQPFPQREIFLHTLARVAERLCPSTNYWPNSPFGGSVVYDDTIGDLHQWKVWHLAQDPYQNYKDLGGRFVSEFGMQGFPINRTVQHFLRGTPASEHHPHSRTIDCHNKCTGADTRIARYLAENFRYDTSSLENYGYATQLLQSEAYSYALRDWKRQFNGPGDEACAGALIWQLNDVYPGISWAFIDYFLRPKPAYYSIRRICAPISVGTSRTPRTRRPDENALRSSLVPSFELFAHNTTTHDVDCQMVVEAYDMATSSWTGLPPEVSKRAVTLRAGYNTELGPIESHSSWIDDSLIVLSVTLFEQTTGERLAQTVDWPEPFRYLNWPNNTCLTVGLEELDDADIEWEQQITLKANQPLKGVWLEPVYDGAERDEDPEPFWEDNMVDLMPEQELRLRVRGLRGRRVHARYLADWEIGQARKK